MLQKIYECCFQTKTTRYKYTYDGHETINVGDKVFVPLNGNEKTVIVQEIILDDTENYPYQIKKIIRKATVDGNNP